MSFAEYYSIFVHGPKKFLVHPYSNRDEIIEFLGGLGSIDVVVLGGDILGISVAHQLALNGLTVVLIGDFCDSIEPFWSSKLWVKSKYLKYCPRVRGEISNNPCDRFSARVNINLKDLEDGYIGNSRLLALDLLRAARSEGVFALNKLDVGISYRSDERSFLKIKDSGREFILKAGLIVSTTSFEEETARIAKEVELIPKIVTNNLTLTPDGGGYVFIEGDGDPKEIVSSLSDIQNIRIRPSSKEESWNYTKGVLSPVKRGETYKMIKAALDSIVDLTEHKLNIFERRLPSITHPIEELIENLTDLNELSKNELVDVKSLLPS